MSTLIGAEHERWPLARAIDALGDAARQAGAPALIWLAGLFYPTLTLSLGNAGDLVLLRIRNGEVPQPRLDWTFNNVHDPLLGYPLAMLPLILPFAMRLIVGLARISSPQRWSELAAGRRAPRFRDAWRAGRGLTFSSFGLWLQLLVMLAGAAVVLLVPSYFFLRGLGLRGDTNFERIALGALMSPFLATLMAYGFLLSVLYQLALQSLAQNRRGVASAIHHAWRIARNDPSATLRAVVVDFVLWLTAAFLTVVLVLTIVGAPLAVCVAGFAGTTRACYWARTYRVLGGLSAVDGVPGL
jgi:hypothetical protein